MGQLLHGVDDTIFLPRLAASSDRAVIEALAAALGDHVLPSFVGAALAREKRSPTGLPFPDVAVAIPHAEPEHVARPAIVVASLASPVKFRQMGSPRATVDAALVVMPALSSKEQAGAALASLIQSLQDARIRAALAAAATADEMRAAVEGGGR
ncbi:MAG: PTS sugar transporter subunit IIA [Myxococcales bacterium]|jgi:PTS system galactitol-specific IIA component|nr:PTS sugar transporter subunit IIA [Myxococcales bacterium]